MLLCLGYTYTHGAGDTSANYHQVSLGGDYFLSKRTDLYLVGAYQHASGHQRDAATGGIVNAGASVGSYGYRKAGSSSQEIISLGIRHKFVNGLDGLLKLTQFRNPATGAKPVAGFFRP